MTATVSQAIEEAVAEEFVDPKPPGVGPFGKTGSILLFADLLMTAVLLKLSPLWWFGWVFGAVTFPLLVVGTIRDPRTGETRLSNWNRKRLHKQGEKRGWTQYLSGPVSPREDKGFPLPGFLAQSRLHTAKTVTGQEYGLVEIPATGDFGVGIRCNPDGASLLTDRTLLQFSKKYGEALKFLCNEPNAIQAMVTVQTSPDPGDSERQRILSSIKPGASAYSRKVLTELAEMTPPGAAVVDSFVTVTFESDHAGKKRSAPQMATDLAPRLGTIVKRLVDGGAGACKLMSPQDITDSVQSAYDPAAAKHITRMRAAGLDTGARWDAIGPPRADNQWSHYAHASAVTVTWTMCDIEGEVNLTTLEPLIRADNACDVKRVSMGMRLRKPEEKNRVAKTDQRHAKFHTIGTDTSVQDTLRHSSASQTARDVARSAGLVDIFFIITASVCDRTTTTVGEDGQPVTVVERAIDRVPGMVAHVEQAAPQAMLAIRRQDGGHSATFAAGLGMGIPLVPRKHSKLSTAFQEEL